MMTMTMMTMMMTMTITVGKREASGDSGLKLSALLTGEIAALLAFTIIIVIIIVIIIIFIIIILMIKMTMMIKGVRCNKFWGASSPQRPPKLSNLIIWQNLTA